jgi:murein DD-endopeptidase MepM/ murein hydrolase activator NlpD
MRARMAAAFVLGFALGVLCLGAGLWRSGALVKVVPPWKKAMVAPTTGNLDQLMADIGKQAPPPVPPPVMDPLDSSQPAPAPLPAPALQPKPIGPTVPEGRGEADRIAPGMNGPHLGMPLSGIDPKKVADTFADVRDGRKHEALDIAAPRGTPVLAVAQGNVAKLFTSKDGGLTVYQFDDSRTFCYYYAHLDRYATGLQEGTLLRPGEVLGYVGSTGNASAKAPHLHFAVFKLGREKKWWEGTAIDPLPLLK